MKEEGMQYPLRGYDPYTGKVVPREVDTPEGKGIRTQEDVDRNVEYDFVRKQGRERLNETIKAMRKTTSGNQPK